MKLCLDACVLYPTVMRALLLGAAEAGFFSPLWSARILEEWRRAALKRGAAEGVQAEGEIALLRASWPRAEVRPAPGLEARLWLPDPADVHVLAAAVTGAAEGIVTLNAKDFPRHLLAEEGLMRADPDGLLLCFTQADRRRMEAVAAAVRAEAARLSGEAWEMRALMKKARLPRLGKALGP